MSVLAVIATRKKSVVLAVITVWKKHSSQPAQLSMEDLLIYILPSKKLLPVSFPGHA